MFLFSGSLSLSNRGRPRSRCDHPWECARRGGVSYEVSFVWYHSPLPIAYLYSAAHGVASSRVPLFGAPLRQASGRPFLQEAPSARLRCSYNRRAAHTVGVLRTLLRRGRHV